MTAPRALAVVLHDVAPARWERCLQVLEAVHACTGTRVPLTLLVVPCWHGDPATPPAYLRWLHRQARVGHELALHGLTHHDDGPPPTAWRDMLRRHVYTDREGEFAALSFDEASNRLAAGRRWAAAHGLAMHGFVPPAWLANADSQRAVAAAGFAWTCSLAALRALPGGPERPAPALVFSTRAAWRRATSRAWNATLAWRARRAPLLRLELHPDDAAHPAIRALWTRLLVQALATRTPVTLGTAAAAGTPSAEAPP